MLDKLRQMEENYHAMQEKMMDPDVVGDNQQYAQLMREYKHMQPIMEKYHEYLQAQRDFTEAKELLDSETDPELREMAQAELEQSRAAMETMQEELKRLLLPKDPNDDRNVIIEIRGGAGGDEASLFAASLYRMYTMYAETQGWKQEVLSANETELGGYKEISFSILGEGAYSRLKYESGVHRVQRVPETESQGRIHTSTVTVAVLVEADEVAVEINPTDLRIDVFRASGAGGQQDFVLGAYLSKGGKSFICLSSTHADKDGTLHSRIRPTLQNGSVVTDTRVNTMYVVTEYGCVCLKGLTVWERAEKLISIAHPDFREELIREAEKQKIWYPHNRR